LPPPAAGQRRRARGRGRGGRRRVDVTLELDAAPRQVEVPPDLAAALAADPGARRFFDGLSYSERRWFVLNVESAKKPETRARRVASAVERLASGRGQR
jgi:uncharacterized protein YdeI (YjbR/CyaY-like superfamily)